MPLFAVNSKLSQRIKLAVPLTSIKSLIVTLLLTTYQPVDQDVVVLSTIVYSLHPPGTGFTV